MAEFDIRKQMSEKEQDNALRPLCFADFAGQSKVTSNLKIFVEAAKLRNESLDHVLLFGPPAHGELHPTDVHPSVSVRRRHQR